MAGALSIVLDPTEPPHVGGALRGVVRITTDESLEGCVLSVHARLRGVRRSDEAGGYDDEAREYAASREVTFELPRLRGPASCIVHLFELRWAVIAELRRGDEVIATEKLDIEVERRGSEEQDEGDVVMGGYREAPRRIHPSFEPALGSRHVEGLRRTEDAGFVAALERALLGHRDVDAQLEVDPPRLEGGGPLAVTLFLYARSPTRIHRAALTLARREGWSDLLVGSREEVIAEETLATSLDVEAGHHRLGGRLVVPDNPPGSYADDCFFIEWLVRAVITSEAGTDLVREFVVSVL